MTETMSNLNHDELELGVARASIDSFLRPVLISLLFSASFWMFVSTALFSLSIVKMQWPTALELSFLSYGKIAPAAVHTFVYGWCSMAALGIGVWILARLSSRVSHGRAMAVCGVVIWNVGVALGLLSILLGAMRPFIGLEASLSSTFMIILGFALIASWAFLSLKDCPGEFQVSRIFISSAIAWFLWSGIAGNALLSSSYLKGVPEHLVALWTWHGVLWMWLVPCVLGISFYLFPRACRADLYSGVLGRGSFWLYFLFSGFGSSLKLCGGPIPLWIGTVSSCSVLLMVIPLGISIYNLLLTGLGSFRITGSPTGIFIRFGLLAMGASTVLLAIRVLRSSVNSLSLTLFDLGVEKLLLQGSVSMILFGGIYYIMPRISRCEWISSSLIRVHYFCFSYGAAVGGFMLMLSGILAGSDLADSSSSFSQVLLDSSFFYCGVFISIALVAVGLFAFAVNFLLITLGLGQPEGEPTVLTVSHNH